MSITLARECKLKQRFAYKWPKDSSSHIAFNTDEEEMQVKWNPASMKYFL